MKSALPLLFLLKISVLSQLIRDLVFWPLKANMASRKYRPTPFPTLQRARKTTGLFITTELNILQNFNDRMFKRHHRDAVWGWGSTKYFPLVDRVSIPLCISLRNKENLYLLAKDPKFARKLVTTWNGGFPENVAAWWHLSQFLPAVFPQWALMDYLPFSRPLRSSKKSLTEVLTYLYPASSPVDNGGKWSSQCWGAVENSEAEAGLYEQNYPLWGPALLYFLINLSSVGAVVTSSFNFLGEMKSGHCIYTRGRSGPATVSVVSWLCSFSIGIQWVDTYTKTDQCLHFKYSHYTTMSQER